MHVQDATMRHRELTQEIFNIGDEVAAYIENIAEAVADWDAELVEDCLAEFEEIIDDARHDSRQVVTELIGIRQALTSGLRSGTVSVVAPKCKEVARPVVMTSADLDERFPIQRSPIMVGELTQALDARTDLIGEYLAHIVEWVLAETERGARDTDSVNLPILYARTSDAVVAAAQAWVESVAEEHPAYARMMRGTNPPTFLNERARIDEIVARVAAKKRQQAAGADAS